MSWFLVDDGLHSHDKTLDLCSTATGRQAMGLWAVAGSWCGAHSETQGELTFDRVRSLGFKTSIAFELVRAGFWSETDRGYVFHEWHVWQKHIAKDDAKRTKTRERVAKHRSGNALRNATENDGNPIPGHTVPSHTVPSRAEENTAHILEFEHERLYAKKRAMAPTKSTAYRKQLADASRWCDAQSATEGLEVDRVIGRLLDGLFASQNPRVVGDWGMRFLGNDCSEFYAPPEADKHAAGGPEDVARRMRDEVPIEH